VPATDQIVAAQDQHPPIVIITTNEDRELPAAFLRRCAVLNLQPPESRLNKEAFVGWLQARAMVHPDLVSLATPGKSQQYSPMYLAAEQTWADREVAAEATLPTVGLAEYLDLLYSLRGLAGDDSERAEELLLKISAYALVKHRETPQTRQPVEMSAAV
jgi:MoxR-like ATPase